MRELVFTPIAEARLEDISDWAFEKFGARQATRYEDELVSRCIAISNGSAVTQNCSVIMEPGAKTQLRFGRAGRHLIIFLDRESHCVIVDLLHSSSNLAGHIETLSRLYGSDS